MKKVAAGGEKGDINNDANKAKTLLWETSISIWAVASKLFLFVHYLFWDGGYTFEEIFGDYFFEILLHFLLLCLLPVLALIVIRINRKKVKNGTQPAGKLFSIISVILLAHTFALILFMPMLNRYSNGWIGDVFAFLLIFLLIDILLFVFATLAMRSVQRETVIPHPSPYHPPTDGVNTGERLTDGLKSGAPSQTSPAQLTAAKCTQCGANMEVDASQESGLCAFCGATYITRKAIENYNKASGGEIPLTAAKCTQCGANMEVDASQESGLCAFCGATFITKKVIDNYNAFVAEPGRYAAENSPQHIDAALRNIEEFKRQKEEAEQKENLMREQEEAERKEELMRRKLRREERMKEKRPFSLKLKELRTGKNLSQSELAKIANVSNETVNNWEKGISAPDIDKLVILAKYFDVPTDYLLGL